MKTVKNNRKTDEEIELEILEDELRYYEEENESDDDDSSNDYPPELDLIRRQTSIMSD